jgi:8-oxo-dGTP pyrophosphatase MutT (NUDIX family)
MGGMSAFPGGTVDPDDFDETALCSETESFLASISQTLSQAEQRAFYVAAVRELFEETGVLIARDGDGRRIHGAGSPVSDLVREETDSGKSFSAALKIHQMRLSCAELIPYARWITPTAQPQRFDAYFFLAEAPADLRAEADAHETTSAFWLTPFHALQSNMEGTITLAPPTLKIVHDLAHFSTFRELEKSLRPHNLEPVQPVMCRNGDGLMIVLPTDPDYAQAPAGAGCRGQRPIGRGEEPTRLVFENKRWTLCLVER